MSGIIRFGIAGWSYPDWEGIVYPKPKPKGFEPLELIAQMVDAVEINSSFYAPVSPHNAKEWIKIVRQMPEFRFTAKLWQKFTHEQTSWSKDEVLLWKKGIEPLASSGRLSCLLIQFPFSFRENQENFERLKKIVEEFKEYHLAVEVRHNSWQKQKFWDWLEEHRISFTNIDQPIFKGSLPPSEILTSSLGYVRLHGRNRENWFKENVETRERYDYLYSREELLSWSERIKNLAEGARELFVIANNHFQGKGLANALELKFLFSGKKSIAPQNLLAHYPRLREFCLPREGQGELFKPSSG